MNRFYHLTSTIFFTCGSFTAVFGGEVLTVAKPLQSVSPVQKTAASVILVAQPIVTAQAQLETPPDNGVASPAELSTSAKENKTTAEPGAGQTKTIQSHYNTGALETERVVRMTDVGHFENHGPYKLWDPQGGLVAIGAYQAGSPSGGWKRIYREQNATKLFSPEQGNFELPLISTFQFTDGTLDGEWKIADSAGRPVRKWNFQQGILHGEIVVFFGSGSRMLSASYDSGVPVGTHREWTSEGDIVETHTFENGRLRAMTEFHWPDGTLQAKGPLLHPRYRLRVEADWWNGGIHIETSEAIGESHKVGQWVYYTRDGQTAETGMYVRGEREGLFSWWYPRGQLQVRGNFAAGSPHGEWTWWHQNGATQTVGHYQHGLQAGKWTQWNANGSEAGIVDHSPTPKASTVEPPAKKPTDSKIRRRSTDIPLTADRDSQRNFRLRPAVELRQ